jgi:transcriptional regulator with XRE-family HTH domain
VRSPCDGYELAEWRCEQLADHVMKRPRKFALKHTEREALGHTNAAEFVARAAKSICMPPKGVDRATQLRYHLGARIRALREARGLTQEMIADRIDGTQKYMSQVECGHRSPSWETLVAIAHRGFEIKLATLMFGIDEDNGVEVQDLSDVLAGRPKEARRDLLHAMKLILRAGQDRSSVATSTVATRPRPRHREIDDPVIAMRRPAARTGPARGRRVEPTDSG